MENGLLIYSGIRRQNSPWYLAKKVIRPIWKQDFVFVLFVHILGSFASFFLINPNISNNTTLAIHIFRSAFFFSLHTYTQSFPLPFLLLCFPSLPSN